MVSDLVSGIQITRQLLANENEPTLLNATIIGSVPGMDEDNTVNSPLGVVTPMSNGFNATNVRFYNYNFNDAAAIGTTKVLYGTFMVDSGVWTAKFSNLTINDSSVTKRINYQGSWNSIFEDMDGTLTDLEPTSWAIANLKHNQMAADCEESLQLHDGLICKNTVTARGLVIHDVRPATHNTESLKILFYTEIPDCEDPDDYFADDSNYSIFDQSLNALPDIQWAIPFVTGQKYLVKFGDDLDWT